MFDFFISHSSQNKVQIVDPLVNILQNMGYDVWYDKDQILLGDNVSDKIKLGLKKSYCLIMIFTDDFFKSNWTLFETGFFASSNAPLMIPLIYNLSNTNMQKFLELWGNLKYIDMSKVTIEEAVSDLAKALTNTKNSNQSQSVSLQLESIQKKIASFETLNSEIVSLKLGEYLSLIKSNSDFLIVSAKSIVKTIVLDLLKTKGKSDFFEISKENISDVLVQANIGSQNLREYIEYIYSLNSDEFVKDPVVINHALLNILYYYLHTKYSMELQFTKIEVAYPSELSYEDFVDMYEIDKKVMREDLIADVSTTYDWYKYNKYTHIAVREILTRKIIGYFSVLPITDDTYEQIINGTFKDKDFTTDNIKQYIFSDFYKVYVAGVGIDPVYQNTGAFIMLYNALIDLILQLASDREIYISEVLAEASTKQGEKFCKMVGMKKITSTESGTDIYRIITIPPQFELKNKMGRELYNLCCKKYNEYRDYFK